MSQSPSTNTTSVAPNKKIRCLVVQLARLGDTLQSLMALRAAKQLYPQLEIHFVARDKFAAAAKRVPWINEVITLPSEAILGPILRGEKRDTQGLSEVAQWISPMIQEPWDLVVNWSYSEASSFLTGLVPAKIKLGFSRRKDTSFASSDGWSHYIQAIVQGRLEQNIHLTDILTTQLLTALQIHFGEPANTGDAPVTSKSFFSLEIDESKARSSAWAQRDTSRKWIAFQLGTGRADKTWDPENWASLANEIFTEHPEYNVVLLGGKDDESRAQTFLSSLASKNKATNRVISLVGETSFDLWASVVSRCSWVFAGDTAAIHLASVLGTRVINISIGPVRWSETGPYGNGHYVISSNLPCTGCEDKDTVHSCKDTVTAQGVFATWTYAASEWVHRRKISIEEHFAEHGTAEHLDSLSIYRSKIRNTDDGGGVVYESVIKRPLRVQDWSAMVMGHIARAWYCGWVPGVGHELARGQISPALVQNLRQLDETSVVLSKVYDEAISIAKRLHTKSANLKSEKIMRIKDREELREYGKKLIELDRLAERLGNTHKPLRAFSQMSKVLMHNLKSAHLSELGRESAESYKHLHEGVNIFREWVKHTLQLAKPMAVISAPAEIKETSP